MKRAVWWAVLVGMMGCAGLLSTNMGHVQRIAWRTQVLRQLDTLWMWSLEDQTEEAVCLYGMRNISGTAVYVREARPPARELDLQANSISVECYKSDTFLGMAHTHPNGSDEPSKTDMAQLDKVDLVTVVCGRGCRTSWLSGHVLPIERVSR